MHNDENASDNPGNLANRRGFLAAHLNAIAITMLSTVAVITSAIAIQQYQEANFEHNRAEFNKKALDEVTAKYSKDLIEMAQQRNNVLKKEIIVEKQRNYTISALCRVKDHLVGHSDSPLVHDASVCNAKLVAVGDRELQNADSTTNKWLFDEPVLSVAHQAMDGHDAAVKIHENASQAKLDSNLNNTKKELGTLGDKLNNIKGYLLNADRINQSLAFRLNIYGTVSKKNPNKRAGIPLLSSMVNDTFNLNKSLYQAIQAITQTKDEITPSRSLPHYTSNVPKHAHIRHG